MSNDSQQGVPLDQNPCTGPRIIRPAMEREAWLVDAQTRHAAHASGTPLGPVTGLPRLDRELGRALQTGIHVVHGAPGTGKTALGLQIACSCGCPSLFVFCEMDLLELLRRLVARVTETPLGRLKSGELPPEQALALFDRACAAVPHLLLADASRAFASCEWLLQAAQVAKGEAKEILIVIDSVHSWAEGCPEEGSEYELLNAGLSELRSLAATLACPILVIAERNRLSMYRGGLSAGAGTRKLEYGAESVWDLARDPNAPPLASGEEPVSLTLQKNRNGAAGSEIGLAFHGALQRFREE
jgi:replicative DNA helicase